MLKIISNTNVEISDTSTYIFNNKFSIFMENNLGTRYGINELKYESFWKARCKKENILS